jgi:hypothetical protein
MVAQLSFFLRLRIIFSLDSKASKFLLALLLKTNSQFSLYLTNMQINYHSICSNINLWKCAQITIELHNNLNLLLQLLVSGTILLENLHFAPGFKSQQHA